MNFIEITLMCLMWAAYAISMAGVLRHAIKGRLPISCQDSSYVYRSEHPLMFWSVVAGLAVVYVGVGASWILYMIRQ